MATIVNARVRPRSGEDYRAPSRPRTAGLVLAFLGLVVAVIAFIGSLVAAGSPGLRESTLAWAFGLTTTAFGTIKLGIAVVLWGILMKLWLRVESVHEALPRLATIRPGDVQTGDVRTPHGVATVTTDQPSELGIHRMAKAMWSPMLVMGVMAVIAGLIVSFVWAATGRLDTAAWTQGLQFLGEAMLLSGISFLLGTILWAIRTAGGEVQSELGVAVKTLKMPGTAKAFVFLMMLGLTVSILQFILYLVVAAGNAANPEAWFAFLGPLRELGLGLILSGITLALVTIAKALGFQFDRMVELITTGR